MEIKPNSQNLEEKGSLDWRNDLTDSALLEVEEKIKRAVYPTQSASPEFESVLKAKILEKRQERQSMFKSFFNFEKVFKFQRLVPVVAVFLIVSIIFGLTYFWPSGPGGGGKFGPGGIFSGFSNLIISPAFAQDNFELIATKKDSLGVEGDSIYILKSKEVLDTKLVKENLVVEPAIDYDFKEISKNEWQIIPKEPVAPNILVKVAVATSYFESDGTQKERDYSWVYQIKDTFKVINSIPRQAATYVPVDSGIEVTFSHENFTDFEKYFSIKPQVKGKFEKHGRTLVFVPSDKLTPGQIYQVTIARGLGLTDSAEVLGEDYTFSFETTKGVASPDQWFIVNRNLYEFGTSEKPLIQVSARNVPNNEVSVAVYQFTGWQSYLDSLKKKDLLPWWSATKEQYLEDTTKLALVNNFKQTIKQDNYVYFVEFPENLAGGYYLVEFEALNQKSQVWIQVTDLAAYLNISKTKTLVWVNSLQSKKPVSNAAVNFIGLSGEGKTNQQGVATLETPNEFLALNNNKDKNERYYLQISSGDQVLIMAASQLSYNYYGGYEANAADDYWQYLYTDRPLYQPTDTIKYFGLIQARDNRNIDQEVKVILYKEGYVDYYWRPVTIAEQTLKLSPAGTFSGEIAFKNLRPDYYVLVLKVGDQVIKQRYLNISRYTKPAYKITLIPDKKATFAGDNINLKVQASFFEGTPVPNLDLVFQMPEGDYLFKTDAKGQANLTYTKKYYDCANSPRRSCWPEYAWLSVRPQQSELADISADASVKFFGAEVYLQSEINYPQAKMAELKLTSKKIDLNMVNDDYWWSNDLGKEIAPGTKLEGQVIKVTYVKRETGTYYDFINKRTYKQYEYTQKEELVDQFNAVTDNAGNYTYRRQVEPETSYRVEIRAFDQKGHYEDYSHYFYYYDGQALKHYFSTWNYYHLQLPENTQYSVNEEVVAKFLNSDDLMPAGEDKYLFVQMQNGFQEYSVNSQPEYKFKFETRDVPNVNLVGIYFNGSSYITTGTYGGGSVYFDARKHKSLDLEIKTDKEKYRPGEEVKLSLAVKDVNGRPVSAEVNLNLIDEAFYAVAEDFVDPLSSIYGALASGTLFTNSSHYVISQMFGGAEKGGCFLAGTLVTLADGHKKPIEGIQRGEKILTFVDPVTKQKETAEVTEIYQHIVSEYLVINGGLKVTPAHLVYSNFRFKEARELKVGDWLLNENGQEVIITNIESVEKIIPVYNLRTDPWHTYFADGIYVHNEKGGGPRESFTDAALFQSVQTNQAGQAEVKFKLPDNITSWRITAQGLTADLQVGLKIQKIPVSLPVFAEVTLGNEYLQADRPIARLRAFGVDLMAGDQATFKVSAPTLGVEQSKPLATTAFQPAYYQLPDLKLGKHYITYSLETPRGKDALKLPVDVITSRLQASFAKNEKLTTDTRIKAENDLPVTVVFSDQGQNQLYPFLQELSWEFGDRVDQQIAKKQARGMLKDYYQEEISPAKFEAFNYQLTSGGISLLPYSSEDLELSAKVAAVAKTDFDQQSLAQYFYKKVDSQKSNREEISYALFGLAELNQPVLPRIEDWLKRDDLTAKEKMYLALALYDLGAAEWGRDLYQQVIDQYSQKQDPYLIIKLNDQEETFQTTALAAIMASALNKTAERDGFWSYLINEHRTWGKDKNSEQLINLEKLSYLKHTLPNLKPGPSKVTYQLFGQDKEVEITGGNIYSFQVEAKDADQIKFLQVQGDIGVASIQVKPVDLSNVAISGDLSLKREYYVDGKKTNKFKQDDIIEIRLYPNLSKKAIAGIYQITDILPSGLLPVTRLYSLNQEIDCHYWYPYNIDGQLVKYILDRDWRGLYCGAADYISYYARVKNAGEYQAEPALVQSLVNPQYLNYSSAEKISISE